MTYGFIFINLLLLFIINLAISIEFDPLGYIVYCPCMGRFGNQADHFLGALAFAIGLNRTLVLPPWVEYRYGELKSTQIPFETYFKVEPLTKIHRVITMENFMKNVAPIEWPENKRVSFCYMARGLVGQSEGCNAKEGNPFGPFWDTYNVDFVGSEFYGPLNYDIHYRDMAKKWKKRYPPLDWPVLSFTGTPASFPVQDENRLLQKYLVWSDNVKNAAENFIKNTLPKGAFIGIHLRNGMDWVKACKHIPDSPSLFSAPQCLGYQNENGKATMDMCLPSKEMIIRQLKRVIKNNNKADSKDKAVKSIFVASDSNHMIDDLEAGLKRMKIRVFKYNKSSPHVDLAILGKSNYFIGNCISSYSAFVKRDRDAKGFPSSFWAFPTEKSGKNSKRDEL